MSRTRSGTSLVEVLTALPLLGLASAMVLLLLVQAGADRRRLAAGYGGARELRHAQAVLAADLAPLVAGDLRVVSDTLLELRGHVGIAMVCGGDSAGIAVALAPGSGDERWPDGLRAGDRLRVWRAPLMPADPPAEALLTLLAPARRIGRVACGHHLITAQWRLATSPPAASGLLAGGPIIVLRDVQYLHYRRGVSWWLGRRTRDGAAWEIVQPVAGPLASPARGGVRLRGLTAGGLTTAFPDSMAALLITLRVPAPNGGPRPSGVILPPDSLRLAVALRAAAWARGRP